VDIYKLSTFTLAGVQALTTDVDELELRVAQLENNVLAGGGANIVGGLLSVDKVKTEELCVGEVCVDEATFLKMASEFGATTTPPTATTTPTSDTEAPVFTLIGNNPATIEIGASYLDPGATVTDNVNTNLGFTYLLDGVSVTSINIDTSEDRTYTITYSATDQAGNTGTAERTVIVGDGGTTTPSVDTTDTEQATSTPQVAEDTTDTTSGATSTPSTTTDTITDTTDTATSTPETASAQAEDTTATATSTPSAGTTTSATSTPQT
jgi:hypothetical protein